MCVEVLCDVRGSSKCSALGDGAICCYVRTSAMVHST